VSYAARPGEESYPIAEALAARGIPFVFSTGYGKKSLPAPCSDRPAVQKPFQRHDLQKLFAEYPSKIRGLGWPWN
jgi:hypothetical protein